MRVTRKGRAIEKARFLSFRKYAEARDRRVIALGRQGWTAREIAVTVGVSLATIYRIAARSSGFSFGRDKQRERNESIVVLRRLNWAAQEIADAVRCSLPTVYRIIEKSVVRNARRRSRDTPEFS